MNFHATTDGRALVMPLESLKMLEDLTVAYAWLYHSSYSLGTIDLRRAMPSSRQKTGSAGAGISLRKRDHDRHQGWYTACALRRAYREDSALSILRPRKTVASDEMMARRKLEWRQTPASGPRRQS